MEKTCKFVKSLRMVRARHDNPTDKAKQSRVYRKNQKEQKRFEAPLRQFIEIKYKNIFQEYVELYNRMNAQNPTKIDLRKSELFKRWKEENQKEANTIDILSKAIKETIEGSENNVDNSVDSENETAAGRQWSSDSEDEASGPEHEESEGNQRGQDGQDEASGAEHQESEGNQWGQDGEDQASGAEHQESEGNQWWQDEGMLAAQQVDALVNELNREDELRALLNTEPENDEGIELNIEDELDFEDFDYRLEVELSNW